MIFQDSGVIAGYDFGVTWDHIKANHDEAFEVRDDDFKQLRRKSLMHNAGDNGYFVGFGFDKAGGVNQFSVSINGSNPETLSRAISIYKQQESKYVGEYGPGECSGQSEGAISKNCEWRDSLDVSLRMHKLEDVEAGGIEVTISKPAE